MCFSNNNNRYDLMVSLTEMFLGLRHKMLYNFFDMILTTFNTSKPFLFFSSLALECNLQLLDTFFIIGWNNLSWHSFPLTCWYWRKNKYRIILPRKNNQFSLSPMLMRPHKKSISFHKLNRSSFQELRRKHKEEV